MSYRLQKQPDHSADTPGVQRKDGQAGDVQHDTGTISLQGHDSQGDWRSAVPARLSIVSIKATGTAEAYGTHAGWQDRGCRQEAGQPYKAERSGIPLSKTGGRRMRHVDLESFAEGKLSAKLNKELERVARNIQDPNTDPIKERKITVTIKIKANHDRDYTDCYIETKSVLAPDAGIRTGFSIGKDLKTGVVDMMETVNQIPGQMSFDEVETEERPEQTFDPETGEIYEANDKVVDLRARKM